MSRGEDDRVPVNETQGFRKTKMEEIMTICFLIKNEGEQPTICLAEKKRGFRTGKVNGYGGKLETGETLEECAIRETREEARIIVKELEKYAYIEFVEPHITHICHVYVTESWEGEPQETEEMLPSWFGVEEIPFDRMGQADPHWLLPILGGKKLEARFYYNEKSEMIDTEVEYLEEL